MAGIYLHIPFCKTRCIYCDFYSTTRSELKTRYVQALCRELTMRKEYLKGEDIETIYFGGGTPSQLEKEDFELIFDTIREHYGLNHCQEITLEANPDDLSQEYLEMLSSLPFNRLSMGIQTFDDATLKLLRRRHNARTAIEAIDRCRKADFQNISIDLIYGLPGETKERWENDLRQAISLNVEHISAYHLIYEEDTPIYNMLKQHQISEVDEDSSLEFFTLLIEHLQKAGFEHYEISNFAKNSKYSLHNTSYWQQQKYVGFGPAAHSFDLNSRQWNVAHLKSYIDNLANDRLSFEKEILTDKDKFNEYIMTNLRTMWGIQEEKMQLQFPDFSKTVRPKLAPFLENGSVVCQNGRIRLTEKGWLVSDDVFSDLFVV